VARFDYSDRVRGWGRNNGRFGGVRQQRKLSGGFELGEVFENF
jgi:hypothetical protein